MSSDSDASLTPSLTRKIQNPQVSIVHILYFAIVVTAVLFVVFVLVYLLVCLLLLLFLCMHVFTYVPSYVCNFVSACVVVCDRVCVCSCVYVCSCRCSFVFSSYSCIADNNIPTLNTCRTLWTPEGVAGTHSVREPCSLLHSLAMLQDRRVDK